MRVPAGTEPTSIPGPVGARPPASGVRPAEQVEPVQAPVDAYATAPTRDTSPIIGHGVHREPSRPPPIAGGARAPFPAGAVTERRSAGPDVTLRRVSSDDGPAMQALYDGLSPASVRHRFGRPVVPWGFVEHSLEQLRSGAAQRVAAFEGERMVGDAAFVRDDSGAYEVGITVADDAQGQGLGRRLLLELALRAEAQGIPELMALIDRENVHSKKLFGRAGFTGGSSWDAQVRVRARVSDIVERLQ